MKNVLRKFIFGAVFLSALPIGAKQEQAQNQDGRLFTPGVICASIVALLIAMRAVGNH